MAATKYSLKIEQGASYEKTFNWKNPDGTPLGLTMEYKDVHVALHSLYYHVAAKRDAAVAAAAEAAALAAAVAPAPEATPEA